MYRTLNPSNAELLEEFPSHSDSELERCLVSAAAAWGRWKVSALKQRSELLESVSTQLHARSREFAELIAREMGKPLAQGIAEVEKCASGCSFFAEHSAAVLAPELRSGLSGSGEVRFDPLGPILAIMPWNFPFWQVFRFAAPALMAGNVVLLKHSPNTPGCAQAIAELFEHAGFGADLFQNIRITNDQAARVIADARVRAVTLTGSGRAGRAVAIAAGAALKPAVLELGGSDPFIVFSDADLDHAAGEGVSSRCFNNGQTCISAKRFLVERSISGQFVERFVEGMKARRVGTPLDEGTQNGPLAREDIRAMLQSQVDKSVAAGAKLLCGGSEPDGVGYFYPPTVLAEVRPGQVAFDEELFGPVAAITVFDSEPEALALANNSKYGLAASVWTKDDERLARLIPQLDVGAVFVNETVKSDPALPFGGVKESGFGRELGLEGIRQFTNIKTVKR